VRRHLPAVLLLLAGGALLRISLLSDLYLRYVKPGLRLPLIASGALLVLLGLAGALRDRHPAHQAAEPDHGHPHPHADGVPRSAWLLILPVLLLLFFAPPALGSFIAARDGSGAIARRTAFAELPPRGVVPLSLSDFTARALWDDKESLRGRTVLLTGFVVPGADGTWQLSRVIVSCCAADAQVVKIQVRGLAAPPADTWVQVTGVWRPDPGAQLPVLDAAALTRVPAPSNPYQDTAAPVAR
jgi:uncharacterized repeat protein (TIGR03943 family)